MNRVGVKVCAAFLLACVGWISTLSAEVTPGVENVTVYDRPGWNSYTYNFPFAGGIQKRAGGELVLRFDTADENGINDDFYVEHYREVALSSRDGGRTWREIEPDWRYHMPLELSDGTLVEVVPSKKLLTRAQQRERLEKLGLGEIWRDDCNLLWDLWPASMSDELKRQGLRVWDRARGPLEFDVYLPPGTIATHAAESFVSRVSQDRGAAWDEKTVVDGSAYSHFGCMFAGSVVLPDDTILIPCYGEEKGRNPVVSQVFALRSTDKGRTFERVMIGGEQLNEATFVRHPSGRVVAVIRGPKAISRSFSADGGKTWSEPVETEMEGSPLHAICLASGNILCAYAHREAPGQVRATISRDAGETWEIETTAILRDGIPAQYTSLGGAGAFLGGPGSVQLDDGTIFTFYSLPDVTRVQPGKVVRGHSYIGGSRYTEGVFGRGK